MRSETTESSLIYLTWVIFDSSLYDLSDVLESSRILSKVVVAQGHAVASVRPVALHLQHCVEVSACLAVALLLHGDDILRENDELKKCIISLVLWCCIVQQSFPH